MANRLAQESSPYLRQHANNPVDWYPWGEEALARAKGENKPILLSIGYSACHWCHVMEHESFENTAIAEQMNSNFINIKVDREERPDLDQVYQNVAQLITRSGGWPLTVFLTPDLRPFFGGTYFPPEDRYGRAGFGRVLTALSEAFKTDPNAVAENANRLMDAIGKLEGAKAEGHTRPAAPNLKKIADAVVSTMDWANGGFGGAPKFPNTMNLAYLWRYGLATGFGMAQEATIVSLSKMAEGGIYDHLGGGFHRYSVDEKWAVPHFEKMLYDNALLMKLYAEVLVTADAANLPAAERDLYAQTLEETTAYVLREMKSPEGGFYSTQDADSEGQEGKFFIWNPKSIAEVLSEQEAKVFNLRYGVTEAGNFSEHGVETHETVLAATRTIADVASQIGITADQVKDVLERAKKKLLEARTKRVAPGRDDKIISSWNGLMISGLAWAARALRQEGRGEMSQQALESARVAMDFTRTHLVHDGDRLWSVYKDGKARFNAYLDDYAFLALGALDLARIEEDEGSVDVLVTQAKKWVDVVRKHFTDHDGGGYYFTSDDHEKLIQRPKSLYDQAIPSGNAVMIECLLALAEMSGDATYEREADETLYKLFPTLEQTPFGMGELACAALLYVMGPIIVSGRLSAQACIHPHVFQKAPSGELAREKNSTPAPVEILVCHRKVCDLPLTEPETASQLVSKKLRLA